MSIGFKPCWIDIGAPGLMSWVSTVQAITMAMPMTMAPAWVTGPSAPMVMLEQGWMGIPAST